LKDGWILWEGPRQPVLRGVRGASVFPRAHIRPARNGEAIDPKPQIGYQRPMINLVPIFVSIMMMPLSIPEAGHFGM
jgi:hypothetical protein